MKTQNIFKHVSQRVLVLTLFVFFRITDGHSQNEVYRSDGVIDLRDTDLQNNTISLSGYWNFYESYLLSPSELSAVKSTPIEMPSIWNESLSSGSGHAYGTYTVRLLLPKERLEKVALHIPQLYSAYRLYINDSIKAEVGTVGRSKDEYVPQWKSNVVEFASSDTIELVLQISNFHHHKGGVREAIYFGSSSTIGDKFQQSLIAVLAEVGILLTISVYFFLLAREKKNRRLCIYFALLCVSWALREMFSDLYPVSHYFSSINWFLLVRTEYISLFLIIIFAVLFVNRLFKEISSQAFKYLVVAINILFIVFVLVVPVAIFTRWLPLYLLTGSATLIYSAALVIRAIATDRREAWPLVIGLIILVSLIGYDLVAYKGLLMNDILVGSIGYCIVFICVTVGLLDKVGVIKLGNSSAARLTYKDLYK